MSASLYEVEACNFSISQVLVSYCIKEETSGIVEARGSAVVEALRYKSEGRGFDSR